MRSPICAGLVLMIAASLMLSVYSADKDEKKKPDDKPAPPREYVSVGEVSGVLAKPADGNKLTFRVNQLSLQRGGAAAMGRGKGGPALKEKQDFDLEMTSDVVVRLVKLPPRKDEKGNKLPYTFEELQALKGKSNLRGYQAEVKDLKAGLIVTVHLVHVKGLKGDEANKVFVNRVFIEGEAQVPPEEKKPDKKK